MKPASGIAAFFSLVASVPALAGEGNLNGLHVIYTETSRTEGRTYLDDKRTKWRDHALLRGDITTTNLQTGRTCTTKNGFITLNIDKEKATETLSGVVEINPVCTVLKK